MNKKILIILFASAFIVKLAKCQDILFNSTSRDSAGKTIKAPLLISIKSGKDLTIWGKKQSVKLISADENGWLFKTPDGRQTWSFEMLPDTAETRKQKKPIFYLGQVNEIILNPGGSRQNIFYYKPPK